MLLQEHIIVRGYYNEAVQWADAVRKGYRNGNTYS